MAQSFKTKKGTEIPLLEIEGGVYLEAKWRIFWFREENPLNRIQTEIIGTEEDIGSLVKASIYDPLGGIWATAHKTCQAKKYSDHLEAAETGAVARALALCGYGTQFGNELKEVGVSDGPVKIPEVPSQIDTKEVVKEIDEILLSKPKEIALKAIQKIFNKKRPSSIPKLDPIELQNGLDIMKTPDFWKHLEASCP